MVPKNNLRIIGSWELDLQTSELYWSDETKIIHGVELSFKPELETAIQFYREDYRDKIQLAVTHLIELGENFDLDCCLITKDEDEIWVRSTGLIIQKDVEGNPIKIGGTFENVSQYYNKVTRLEKYWGILNESNMLTISTKGGVIKFVNDNFCKLTGYDRSEVVGKTHRIFNSGYHSKEFFRNLWVHISEGHKWEGEILNKNKDGKLQWIRTIIFPIKNPKGEVDEFISIRYDITDQKELQKKRVEKERLRAVGEIGGQILHEIMTPLSLVKYYSHQLEVLLNNSEHPEGIEITKKLNESSKRVIEIFDDMRSLLKDKDDYEYVDIVKVIRKSYFYTHIQMQKNEVDFVFDIQNNDEKIWGNPGQLTQVFTNLLNNSVQAIKGLDDRWIKASVSVVSDKIIVNIIDSGSGIKPEMQEKVFESLFTTKEKSGGTGLGLAISKRLIERMSGTITIDDTKENTCFRLEFPIKQSVLKVG
jgi:PAS domain S-box-containing protein